MKQLTHKEHMKKDTLTLHLQKIGKKSANKLKETLGKKGYSEEMSRRSRIKKSFIESQKTKELTNLDNRCVN